MIRGAHGHVDRRRGFWGQPKREPSDRVLAPDGVSASDCVVVAVIGSGNVERILEASDPDRCRVCGEPIHPLAALHTICERCADDTRERKTDEQTRRELRGIPDGEPF